LDPQEKMEKMEKMAQTEHRVLWDHQGRAERTVPQDQ